MYGLRATIVANIRRMTDTVNALPDIDDIRQHIVSAQKLLEAMR
jgi:hypothetical protein